MDNPHSPGSSAYYAEIARQARIIDQRLRGEQTSGGPAIGRASPHVVKFHTKARYRSARTAAEKRRWAAMGKVNCEVCGWRLPQWLDTIHGVSANNVHHVVPLKYGGGDERSNLVILCPNHHAMAHRFLWGYSPANSPTKVFPSKEELIRDLKAIDADPELYLVRRMGRLLAPHP